MKLETRNSKPAKASVMSRAASNPRGTNCQVSGANRILSEAISAESKDPNPPKGAPLCRFTHHDGRPCASPAWKRSPGGLCYQHQTRETGNRKRETARRQARAELALSPIRRAHRSDADRADYVLRPLADCPNLDSEANIARVAYLFDRALDVGAIDIRKQRVIHSLLRIARINLRGMRRELAEFGMFELPPAAYRPDDLRTAQAGEPVPQLPVEEPPAGELAFRPAFSTIHERALAPVKQTLDSSSPLNQSRGSLLPQRQSRWGPRLGMTKARGTLNARLKPGSPTGQAEDFL